MHTLFVVHVYYDTFAIKNVKFTFHILDQHTLHLQLTAFVLHCIARYYSKSIRHLFKLSAPVGNGLKVYLQYDISLSMLSDVYLVGGDILFDLVILGGNDYTAYMTCSIPGKAGHDVEMAAEKSEML